MSQPYTGALNSQSKSFFGHPPGLAVCFMTEMWERFCYYGMRAILVLYLVNHHKFSSGNANMLLGTFMGLAYMTPILGGLAADRVLGRKKAIILGSLLMIVGHAFLSYTGVPAYIEGGSLVRDEGLLSIFYISLSLIIVGIGFLKPNISALVGSLYEKDDPRRDSGFTIFYLGINIGSLFAVFFVGLVGEKYGWGYGFSLAGLGMIIGLLIFLLGQRFFPPTEVSQLPVTSSRNGVFLGLSESSIIYLLAIGIIAMSFLLLQHPDAVGVLLLMFGGTTFLMIIVYSLRACERIERNKIFAALFLIGLQPLFWSLYEQQGGSLTLLADQYYDLSSVGFSVYASQVQLLNPLFIILLTPLLAWLWVFLARKNIEPSTPMKFALSMFLIGLGYVVFAQSLGPNGLASGNILWLVFIYFSLTLAEMCMSPIGLSMVTKLSSSKIVGMMMGVWFFGIALGNYTSGVIGRISGGANLASSGGKLDIAATASVYEKVGLLGIAVGLVLILALPVLKKAMHDVR